MTALPCSVDECGGASFKRGMCSKHYHLWRAHGDPTMRVRSERGALLAWIKANVAHADDACLLWHLRWATRAENEADKVVHGTATRGERNASASITEADVLAIRQLAREGRSRASIAREFGLFPQNVSRIVTRTTWRAVA